MELSLTGWVICDCDIDKSIFRALLSAYSDTHTHTCMAFVSACLPAVNRPLTFFHLSVPSQTSIAFHLQRTAQWMQNEQIYPIDCSVPVCIAMLYFVPCHISAARLTRHTDVFSPCMIYEERKRFTYSYAKLITNMQDISAQHQLWPGTRRFPFSTLHSAEWMFIQRCLLFARFSPNEKKKTIQQDARKCNQHFKSNGKNKKTEKWGRNGRIQLKNQKIVAPLVFRQTQIIYLL